jgi:hypothetical protein
MTMDDIVALSQDDKLMPGSSYLAEDTGALIVAAGSNGYLTLEPQS